MSGSGPAWDTVSSVKVDDIQIGRNVYIELIGGDHGKPKCTKASAGKIISCIEEGFKPVICTRYVEHDDTSDVNKMTFIMPSYFTVTKVTNITTGVDTYTLYYVLQDSDEMLYSDPEGNLDKPFTSINPGPEA